MKLQRDPHARFAVLDEREPHMQLSDPALAQVLRGDASAFDPLLAMTRSGVAGTAHVSASVARRAGLSDAPAMAVSAPVAIDAGPPWVILVVASTQALQTQEQTLVRRIIVGGALGLLLLLSAAGYVLHTTLRARELRERVRNEERLLHSEKLVTAGQLAAGIAHEIGTPLNVARGRVELALAHLGPTHPEAENHRIVIEQVDRVVRLIQQLLDYVRPAPATVQQIDLSAPLARVEELLGPQASKRQVALRRDVSASLPRFSADPDQIQQILVNLALNAIDACDRGGEVTLRATSRGTDVVLEVQDTGQGIPAEIRNQIFDPFFTTKKRGQGTGLGLWVVAQLLRSQSAEIAIDSTVGKGTIMRITWRATE
jgi:signal transduction histidine kinase